jgi:hypothetical protein
MAHSTIQPMGNRPYAAPFSAASPAVPAGIEYTVVATISAVASPASAAQWALTLKMPSRPSNTITGRAATSAESAMLPATGV